jgi:hypothetical protein
MHALTSDDEMVTSLPTSSCPYLVALKRARQYREYGVPRGAIESVSSEQAHIE